MQKMVFPTEALYQGFDVVPLMWKMLYASVPDWQAAGVVKRNDSFGFVAAKPRAMVDWAEAWDDFDELIWFGIGWGPEAQRYMRNAARKIRASARIGRPTLYLVENKFKLWANPIDGDCEDYHSDFPWGGAAAVRKRQLTGTSALTQEQDDAVSHMGGAFLDNILLTISKSLEAA